MAFPTGYTLYQNVTVDNTKVDATLTDYPCLVDLSDMVKAGDDIFDTCRSDGGDIRVTLSDGTTQLAREVVSIDTGAKTGELHVKIPSLASGTDTVIRIWYNGTDTEPAEDATYGKENTWHSDYQLVQHMNQDPSGSAPQMVDSTSNNHDGTSQGSMTSGDLVPAQIGDGLTFDGSNDYIELGDSAKTIDKGATQLSISFWADIGDFGAGIIGRDAIRTFFISKDTTNDVITFGVSGNGSTIAARITGSTAINGALHKVLCVYDGTNDLKLYIDGASEGGITGTEPSSLWTGSTSFELQIAKSYRFDTAGVGVMNGILDEVRMSHNAPSAGWELTEYNNQSSPSTFYSVGDEQGSGTTAALSGTAVDGVTESEIVTGGETVIITLTDDTFVTGTSSLDGIVAGLSGSASWNSEVRDAMDNNDVVLSVGDTVATITLPAAAGYSISEDDTITETIPAASLTTSGDAVVATPTFDVTNEGGGSLLPIIMNDQTISMIGKKINTGSVKIAAGSATLENSGKEGKNASLLSLLDPNISILSGSKGNTGELSTIIDIVIAMLGFESEVIFSGVLNTSLDPQSILYSGSKGNAGIIDTQIQNLINLILGVKGNTARVDINVFTETELFAKLGTSGKLNIILDDLEIRLIEVTITDEIFKILVSMKTGQITILGPKTGTINIEGLS